METVKNIPVLKLGVRNHNLRVYTSKNIKDVINNFNKKKLQGTVYGELKLGNEETSFDTISLTKASHTIERIYLDDDIVYCDINILDTHCGKVALSMLEAGTAVLRTRSIGTMDGKFANIDKLITLDVIEAEFDSYKGIL